MTNKSRAIFTALHTLASFAFGALGYYFQTELQPTMPLIPAICGASAFFNAAAAGVYFSRIEGSK
jgi:hypothetical protein